MAQASVTKIDHKTRWSEAEWETRVQLAACYRLVARYRMTDTIYTHISARVPGVEDQFLLNPYGLMFDEITASSLVKIDLDGRLVEESDYRVNAAGFTIHSAIHAARHDVFCVLHTHTRAGMAVACQKQGLLPLTQNAMFFSGVGLHDYEGPAVDLDEQKRLVSDLGSHDAMILRNHGLLTAGRTIPEAFSLMFYLERACEIQIAALAGGSELVIPSPEVCEKTARQIERDNDAPLGDQEWAAHIRALDREDASYRN